MAENRNKKLLFQIYIFLWCSSRLYFQFCILSPCMAYHPSALSSPHFL